MTMSTAALLDPLHDQGVGSDDLDRPKRRRFNAEYKQAILDEYDRLTDPGAKGALLRREGLYTSHIVDWRRQRDAGVREALGEKRRAPHKTPEQRELERLRRRNQKLEADLASHKLALEIQGKASELLERLLAESDTPSGQQP